MTIQEAYDEWSEEKDVKTFAIKSRQFWNRAWKKLDMNIPCSEAKMPVLLMALQAVSLDKETVVKASSVMVYVLKYAHAQDYKVNPLPASEYSDILHQWEGSPTEDESKVKAGRKFRESVPKLTESVPKLPKNDPKLTENVPELPKSVEKLPKPKKQVVKKIGQKVVKKTAKKSKDESKKSKAPQNGNIRLTKDGKRYNPSRERRQIAQIDPSTMEVIKVWPTLREPERALRVTSLWRAIANRRTSGGYYWCDFSDIDTFEPSESHKNPVICHKPVTISKDVEFVAPPTKPKKEEAPADGVHIGNVPEQNPALSDCTDKALIDELKYRGWHGHIHLTIDVYL